MHTRAHTHTHTHTLTHSHTHSLALSLSLSLSLTHTCGQKWTNRRIFATHFFPPHFCFFIFTLSHTPAAKNGQKDAFSRKVHAPPYSFVFPSRLVFSNRGIRDRLKTAHIHMFVSECMCVCGRERVLCVYIAVV